MCCDPLICLLVRCGIIGDKPPAKVLEKLFYEGCFPAKKYKKLHKKQLKAYLKWKWNGRKTIRGLFGNKFEYLFEQK